LKNNKHRGQLYTLVVRREIRKKKIKTNRSSTAIQPLQDYMCHTMWKKAQRRIQGDDGWSELVIERHHMHYLNDADVIHSMVYMEHASIAFLLKNKTWKYKKNPYDPLNYTKYSCQNTKIPPPAKLFFFCLF
jgi:hypothetical protein